MKKFIKIYKGTKIYKVDNHYEIEDCSKEFVSMNECKQFIRFMKGDNE